MGNALMKQDKIAEAIKSYQDSLVENRTREVLCTAARCNTLQHTATHYLKTVFVRSLHTAAHCNILQHTAAYWNIMQHSATLCNTLSEDRIREVVTHCNTLSENYTREVVHMYFVSSLSIFLFMYYARTHPGTSTPPFSVRTHPCLHTHTSQVFTDREMHGSVCSN